MQLKTNILPDEFHDIISSLDIKVLQVFLYNSRKNTATLKVRFNGINAVLKCISNNSSILERERFKNEKSFYLDKQVFTLSPKYLAHGENYLLIEYLEGRTLRERIISSLDKESRGSESTELKLFLKTQLKSVLGQYSVLIEESKNETYISSDYATEKLMGLYSNLASSGPYSTNRSRVSRFINKIFHFLTKNKVKKRVESILKSKQALLKSGFVHGDLHLDNIFVHSNSDKPYIIDFANHEKDGLIIYDLIYFLSTVLTLVDSDKKTKQFLIKIFEEKLDKIDDSFKLILNISLILHHVSRLNSRFNSTVTKSHLIKSYLSFFKKLNNDIKMTLV